MTSQRSGRVGGASVDEERRGAGCHQEGLPPTVGGDEEIGGMRWGQEGGQAILLLRSLIQSERFERGWNVLLSSYKRDVRVPEGVLEFSARRASGIVSA